MKKTLLLFILSFMVLSLSAQNKDLSKYIHNERQTTKSNSGQSNTNSKTIVFDTNSHTYKAGEFLEKSSKFEFAAIGTAAGAGLFAALGVAVAKNETDEYVGSRALYSLSAISGIATVICSIVAVNYRMKAGKELKLSTSGNGTSIAYVF